MFSKRKPFYFLFAHEGETYFRDSMLRMKLQDTLWMDLSKNGYRYIYFVDLDASGYRIRFLDPVSGENYKYWGLFAKYTYNGPGEDVLKPGEFYKWFLGKNKENNGETAFIFQNLAFQKAFDRKSNDKWLTALMNLQATRKNPIILVNPMEITQEQLKLYVDPRGPFGCRESGVCLCPELREIIHTESVQCVFDRMKAQIPDRFLELGAISFSGLQTMLRNLSFRHQLDWSEEELLEYANYLYWTVYSEKLRRVVNNPIREYSTYQHLYTYLSNSSSREGIRERIQALKNMVKRDGKLIDTLNGIERLKKCEDTDSCYVTMAEHTALWQLAGLKIPADLEKTTSEFQIQPVSLAQWQSMQNRVSKPKNRPMPSPELLSRINGLVVQCENACQNKDLDTVRRAMNVLLYCERQLYEGKELDSYVKNSQHYLTISAEYFRLKREVRSYVGGEQGRKTLAIQGAQYRDMLVKLDEVLALSGAMSELNTQKFANLIDSFQKNLNTPQQEEPVFQEPEESYSESEQQAVLEKFMNIH